MSSSSLDTPIGRRSARLVFARPRPSQRHHQGDAGPRAVRLELLADPRRSPVPAAPVDLSPAARRPLPFELLTFDGHPSVFVVAGPDDLRVLRGRPHRDGLGGLLFDTDQAPATVLVDGWLVDLHGGELRVWRLSDPAKGDDTADAEVEAGTALVDLPPWPGLDALLGGLGAEPWLRNRIRYLEQSVDPVDELVAAGSLVRLWTPVDANDRRAALAAAVSGEPQPRGRVRAWLAGVTGWQALRDLTVRRAQRWVDDAAALVDALPESIGHAREEASRLLTERDDLASIERALLVAGERDEAIRRALDAADRAAVVHGGILDDLILVDRDDPWLRTVSRKEPDHWWGAYVR